MQATPGSRETFGRTYLDDIDSTNQIAINVELGEGGPFGKVLQAYTKTSEAYVHNGDQSKMRTLAWLCIAKDHIHTADMGRDRGRQTKRKHR